MSERFFKDMPAISKSPILTEEMMSQVESGSACEGGCKKTCISIINGGFPPNDDSDSSVPDEAEGIAEDIMIQ